METFEYNPCKLASIADCGDPDREASPGARFLIGVQDAVNEAIEWAKDHDEDMDTSDMAHDIADNAVPIYAYAKWLTFVDLAAWQEDLTDWNAERHDEPLDHLSNIALYQIAERLAMVLFSEAADNEEGGEES